MSLAPVVEGSSHGLTWPDQAWSWPPSFLWGKCDKRDLLIITNLPPLHMHVGKVCQLPTEGWRLLMYTLVSYTSKTDRHGMTSLVESGSVEPVSSVDLQTWDGKVPGSNFIRGSRLYPWARHFIHIAQQPKSEMLRLCGANQKQSITHIQIKIVWVWKGECKKNQHKNP